MKRVFLFFVLALGGCAFGSSALNPLANYVGQPVQSVFAAIGYPDRQEIVAGNTVYHWGTDQPEGPSCTVKVVANPAGIVLEWDAYGNAYGCDRYAGGLKRAQRQ